MEPSLTHAEFTQNINAKFQVAIDEQKCVELELVQVSEVKLFPQQEQFAIVFRGPLDMYLGQGTQLFKHEQMGEFELFVVPISKDAQSVYYEAVFNRLREQVAE